jgi:hypothetical protein
LKGRITKVNERYYKIIRSTDPQKLEDEVNDLIQNGWHPLGIMQVVAVGPDQYDLHLYQAMIKLPGSYN